ncbi:MAG: DUF6663 family protein [Halobacteriaceae archaeon]
MSPETRDAYRVLASPRDAGELLLLDRDSFDPTYVPTAGYDGDLAEQVSALRPGYVVGAELDWEDGDPRFAAVEVVERTLFEFVEGASPMFEAALDTWSEAKREGVAVNSRVTRDTDARPNGALYTFAEQSGAADLFAEFRDGERPLDPLLDRVEADPPHEVFVMRPAQGEFVLVYIVLEKGSLLADTVRDTYDCPRPPESE